MSLRLADTRKGQWWRGLQ